MAQFSHISSQIDNILLQRKEKAMRLKLKKEQLREIQKTVRVFSGLPNAANSIKDAFVKEQYVELLKKATIPQKVIADITKLSGKIDEAIRRFDRENLHISTVGKARQGKSTFLQAISGLDNKVIPAYAAGDCTGAVSVIHNDSAVPIGKVRVELTFRNQNDMIEVVKGYINLIDSEYLNTMSLTYETIPEIDLDLLENSIQRGESKKTAYFEHLKRIVDEFNGMSDSQSPPITSLIGRNNMILSDPDDIQKYVAQNNGKSIDDLARENYNAYLAVKRADIYCQFPDQVGKLVLIDTIGLEDIQLGITESMLETVDKESDAVVVVTKPDAVPRDNDFDLYDLLFNNFKHRDMSKWVFYLANKQKGYNDNAVNSFTMKLQEGNFAVAWCKAIDCYSDKELVRNDFLLPMLETVFGNIGAIDSIYLNEIDQMYTKLKNDLQAAISNLPQPENMSAQSMVDLEVSKLGKQCYRNMTSSLYKQVIYWYEQRNKTNATLWNMVKDILNNLEEILPDEEKLQEVLSQSGTLMETTLWQVPLNYVRNAITDQFIAIDDLMEVENIAFKNDLVNDLYHSLKKLSGEVRDNEDDNEDEVTDKAAWLWNVLEPLLQGKEKYEQIYRAFQFLNEFEFNVRAQLILEVRNQLRIINPMTVEYYMKPNYTFSKTNIGKSVHFYLTSRLAILEDGLRHSLSKINKMPNQAFYAAAEEFYDRLTFSSDLKNGTFEDMSDIWGDFFTEFKNLLWSEEMNRHKEAETLTNEYTRLCVELKNKVAALA